MVNKRMFAELSQRCEYGSRWYALGKRLYIRENHEEKLKMMEAAKKMGKNFGKWARETLRKEAERVLNDKE